MSFSMFPSMTFLLSAETEAPLSVPLIPSKIASMVAFTSASLSSSGAAAPAPTYPADPPTEESVRHRPPRLAPCWRAGCPGALDLPLWDFGRCTRGDPTPRARDPPTLPSTPRIVALRLGASRPILTTASALLDLCAQSLLSKGPNWIDRPTNVSRRMTLSERFEKCTRGLDPSGDAVFGEVAPRAAEPCLRAGRDGGLWVVVFRSGGCRGAARGRGGSQKEGRRFDQLRFHEPP